MPTSQLLACRQYIFIFAQHCLSCSFGILLHELITGEVPIRGQLRDLQASLWLAASLVARAAYSQAD